MSTNIPGYQASQALATDVNALNSLKNRGLAKSPQAAREAAKQLESLFMHEMVKSMREASMKSGLLDNSTTDLATGMMDQQLSVNMAGMPGGLTAAITAQIARSMGMNEQEALEGLPMPIGGRERGARASAGTFEIPSTLSLASRTPAAGDSHSRFAQWAASAGLYGTAANAQALDAYAPSPKGRDNFVTAHAGAAQRVARESGIPAHYMLGQAGHETGWGKSEIRGAGGANSFNLFGIKAGGSWTGKVAEITTTEYINGAPQKIKAKFRAYDSYEESFRDYARLITENPRYARAMQSTGNAQAYASALQKAGYATDPQYANKLSRAIESALSVQRGDQG